MYSNYTRETMQFFKSFPLYKYFKSFFREWVKESICWLWDFEEMKIKGRPTWLLWIITIIMLSAIGKYDFLYTQIWPWEIIKWLIVPFLLTTLLTITTKKYQEVDDLQQESNNYQKLLDNRMKRLELANKLKGILNKYNETQLNFYRWCIDKSNLIYSDSFILIEESKIVSPYVIACFEEGKVPFIGLGQIGGHPNEARGFIIQNLEAVW